MFEEDDPIQGSFKGNSYFIQKRETGSFKWKRPEGEEVSFQKLRFQNHAGLWRCKQLLKNKKSARGRMLLSTFLWKNPTLRKQTPLPYFWIPATLPAKQIQYPVTFDEEKITSGNHPQNSFRKQKKVETPLRVHLYTSPKPSNVCPRFVAFGLLASLLFVLLFFKNTHQCDFHNLGEPSAPTVLLPYIQAPYS